MFFLDAYLFWGPLIPLFWTCGDIPSGFQNQRMQPYSHLVGAYEDLSAFHVVHLWCHTGTPLGMVSSQTQKVLLLMVLIDGSAILYEYFQYQMAVLMPLLFRAIVWYVRTNPHYLIHLRQL